jgi:hypothetical protein
MSLFYTKCSEPWAIILTSLYHGENKIHLDEMMMISALYQTNTHSWILKVPTHWNNNMQEDMSLYPDSSQPVIALTPECWVLCRESTNNQFCNLQSTIYCTWGKHVNHYTTNVVNKTLSKSTLSNLLNKIWLHQRYSLNVLQY